MARLTFQFIHGLQMCKDGVTKKVVSFSPRDSFRPSFHKYCKDGLAFVSIYTAGGGRFQLVVQNLSSQVGDIEKSICLFQKKEIHLGIDSGVCKISKPSLYFSCSHITKLIFRPVVCILYISFIFILIPLWAVHKDIVNL
jgi:hypothetical protein